MSALTRLLWLLAAWLGGADHDPECLLLGGLDVVRARAFVAGDASRLGDVYADERTARADVEVLRSYRDRGLRLEGMLMVREACSVSVRAPQRLTLEVVDRLGPTSVVTRSGETRALPHDRPTRRRVVLELTDVGWRVASVREG